MKELIFRCELLSDIVLNASGASEGRLPSHDFIPGSNFLGIVAKEYKAANEKGLSYDLFHSGNVRYGDAHVVLKENRSHKVPACWFYLKGTTAVDGVWLHHKISDDTRNALISAGTQLKQARDGFFIETTNGFNLVHLAGSKQYAMKASFDRVKRKAADSQLFGYTALQPGTVWEFSIHLSNIEANAEATLIAFIKENLRGDRNVGRSRSAQYGRVRITLHSEQEINEDVKEYSGEIALYAESRLSFLDEYGQPTLQPMTDQLRLPPAGKIIWEKSQIRTSRYSPWNGIRHTRDADRVCIDKGSVFVVRLEQTVSLPSKLRGLGVYKNEGFGEMLVDPEFLKTNSENGKLAKEISIAELAEEETVQVASAVSSSSEALVSWLGRQRIKDRNNRKILQLVNGFIEEYKHIYSGKFASQWGAIRTIAARATSPDNLLGELFTPETGYLMHGVAVDKWLKKGRRNIFQRFLTETSESNSDIVVPLIIKLATEMAKAVSMDQKQEVE